jgi:hypothetical protein
MSINLANSTVQKFDDMVKHVYQAKGRLRKMTTMRTGVIGDTYRFQRMGQGMANQKATQACVTPMNVDHANQTATLQRWLAPEYTDIFDNDEVNFDEMSELATTIAMALQRREDQLIIDTLAGGTYVASPTVGNADQGLDIVVGGTGLTVDKLRLVNRRFDDLEIDEGDKYIAVTAKGKNDLLEDSEVTSSDFNTVKALVNGEIDTYLGLKFVTIGSRTEGGLPLNGAARTSFAWHKASVGYAVGNIDMMTKVDYVPERTSWLSNGLLRSGSVIRENAGIIRINHTV